MNDFYKQRKLFQWVKAILLLLTGLLPALFIIEKGHSQPLFYLLFLIYVPVVQFAATPFFTLGYLQILFANVTWVYGK